MKWFFVSLNVALGLFNVAMAINVGGGYVMWFAIFAAIVCFSGAVMTFILHQKH